MKRRIALSLAALMACLLCAPVVGVAATPESAPLVEQNTPMDGMIRVWLSSIKGVSTYNLTLTGNYTMNGATLSSGSKVRVEFGGGVVFVTVNGNRQAMGSGVTLSRQSGGVKIAEALVPANVYPGDMRFFYGGNTQYVVCNLYVEDYIYGVLPYEMDNSFPLEALKAQAVTARTYGIRAKTSGGNYDVTDTTTHQVFRGVNYGKTNCIRAVDETWNIVLQYDGKYVGAYYSASNGGQTESNNHVWGGAALAYLPVKDDPYDLANKYSTQKSYLVYASPQQGSSISAYAMIRQALAAKLGGSADSYTISEITDMKLGTPMYPSPSKLYTKLSVTARHGGGTTTVELSIFPTVESALGLGINGGANELYTVDREDKGFRITARRYGHGVGMSQRGAEQMGQTGYSYVQILGFYYPGAKRVRLSLSTNWPGASPTPAPVGDVAGVSEETPATVTLKKADDRLNLRKSADANADVLDRIPNGETVTILSTTGDWCKVRWGDKTGYVSREFLTVTAAAAPDTGDANTAVVTLKSGSLNLRQSGGASSDIVGSVPNGATVEVLDRGDSWSKVRYNNQIGYVVTQYLQFSAASGQPAQTQPSTPSEVFATVKLENASESVNFRSAASMDAQVLTTVRHGTKVSVLESNADWTKISHQGSVGFIMTKFLSFLENTAASGGADTGATGPRKATVKLKSGSLNLREKADATSRVLALMPNGAGVEVTESGDQWYAVTYNGVKGYAVRDFITVDAAAGNGQPGGAQTAVMTAVVVTKDGDRVNMRRAASSVGAVIDRVPSGAEVEVVESGDAWTKIRYNGQTGFVSTQFLTKERPAPGPAASPTPAPAQSGSSCWVSTKDGGSLYLRKQPSSTAESVTLLPNGAELTLLEIGEKWIKVTYRNQTGYVSGDFIVFTSPSVPAAQQTQPSQAQPQIVGDAKTTVLNTGKTSLNSASATLHLRSTPDDLSGVLAGLRQGDAVEVLQYYGADAAWLYVRAGQAEGYAHREFFKLTYKIGAVALKDAGSSLAMRKSASGSSEMVATLMNGDLVTVLSTSGGWARVRLGDMKTGYVSADYLKVE